MKSLAFFTSILIFTCLAMPAAQAQDNWFSYSQQFSAKGHEGHPFRLTAALRAETEDDSASARLWLRVDKTGGGYGFFENMWLRPVRQNDWKTVKIEGKIDSTASRLVFGALCQYNGRFFYDDLQLDIETMPGQWKTVFANGFEDPTPGWETGIGHPTFGKNDRFQTEISTDRPASGQKCLLVLGKNVPNFGINNKAGKFAQINGIQLYHEIYGEGQPLVVLHGNGGSIADGSIHYAAFLEKKYKLILIDSRAQGRSGDTPAELTYEQMADDAAALLDQLGIDSAFVWGHSDGAIDGLLLALRHPKKVKKLVAFAANLVPDTTGIQPFLFHLTEQTVEKSKDPKERKVVGMMLHHPNYPFSAMEKISAQVLIMSGDRDAIPLEHTVQIFKHLPKSQFCVIPGATHGAAWEKPELFRQLVFDFFEKPFAMPSTVD